MHFVPYTGGTSGLAVFFILSKKVVAETLVSKAVGYCSALTGGGQLGFFSEQYFL